MIDSNVTTLSEYLTPFLTGFLVLILSLWVKDLGSVLVKGLTFKYSRDFNEGDKVVLEGEEAIIVKIGFTQTVFGVYRKSESGSITHYWRFVANERIPFLNIEKVVKE